MGNLIGLLNGIVEFPAGGAGWFPFIGQFVYILISAMHGNGALPYGLAIIFFTIILKLMLLPMDFANRYFTKRNSNFMQKMKPEEDEIRAQYANDPMRINRERQMLYKRHGYKMGGFCLFTIINLFVILAIFMSVFTALRGVATHNVDLSVQNLQAVYKSYEQDIKDETLDATEFKKDINAVYAQHSVGFLWIKNIWKQDVPWTGAGLTWKEYASSAKIITDDELKNCPICAGEHDTAAKLLTAHDYTTNDAGMKAYVADVHDFATPEAYIRHQYDTIYAAMDKSYKRSWNGLLFLIILAGVSSWGTAYITMKMNKTTQAKAAPKEEKFVYSMREVKNKLDPKVPNVDPAMVGKVMMFVLPAIMIFFTMSSTAALAIYIITNSLLSTAITFGMKYPVDKLLAWQDKRKSNRGDTPKIDESVINPHAKYFKGRKKK